MKIYCCLGLELALLTNFGAHGTEIVIDDSDGTLGATGSPVSAVVKLSQKELRAAREGRLLLREVRSAENLAPALTPVQPLHNDDPRQATMLCWEMPGGKPGRRRFTPQTIQPVADSRLTAKRDDVSGQFDITEGGQAVLRYNYATIEPGDFITNVAPASRIYARARSDYIHPLFGLDGETLTKDWSVDHPHHRGIYWAWPEVDWRGQRGDLHALQKVFARPTGKCVTTSGPVFAQLEAENVWQWENGESLVHERAIIRAYHSTGDDRLIDFEFQFTALNDAVSLARRGTLHYGGLNLRLAKVAEQEVIFHTDPTNTTPRMAWAEDSGKFGAAPNPSGIVVLQHRANPDYPGDWVKFPDLNWFQPTFPASGTRYELKPGQPLVLHFRLWLHRGAKASEENCADRWRAYHAAPAPHLLPVR